MIREVKQALAFCAILGAGMVWALATPPRTAARTKAPRAQASPTAASSVAIPFAGSVKDDAGATWSIAGTATVEKQEAPPPPVGVVFGPVTSGIGDPVVTARPSGWICTLHGANFPTVGTRRLTVAGRIAPAATLVWSSVSVQFTVPPGPPSATGATSGPFEVWVQEAGNWKLLGRGGMFTILPDALPPPP